jgi:hypothetical protein
METSSEDGQRRHNVRATVDAKQDADAPATRSMKASGSDDKRDPARMILAEGAIIVFFLPSPRRCAVGEDRDTTPRHATRRSVDPPALLEHARPVRSVRREPADPRPLRPGMEEVISAKSNSTERLWHLPT